MPLQKFVLFVLFISVSLILHAQTADKIVSNYIAATGGKKAWRKVHSIVSSGTYNYGGVEFPFEAWSKAPNMYKYLVKSKGKYFAQAYDGQKGWKIDVFSGEKNKTILEGKPAQAMANEADVELESPFINYKKKNYQVFPEGKDTVNGTTCYKIKLIRPDADTSTWYFNTADYLLVKKQAIAKNAELGHSLLDTYYNDYRTIGKIKIPHQTVSKIGEQTVLTVKIEKIELNVPISNDEFKP